LIATFGKPILSYFQNIFTFYEEDPSFKIFHAYQFKHHAENIHVVNLKKIVFAISFLAVQINKQAALF